MNRICLITLGTASLLSGCRSEPDTGEFTGPELGFRPNILWITCEDITPSLGCYGDPSAKTPVLDQLASEGTRYTNAFSVAGVCAPSRHALITGMYPTSTGGHNMRTIYNQAEGLPDYSVVLPPEVKCFSELLRRGGYYCTNCEKTDYQFVAPATAWDECSVSAHYRHRKPGQPFFAVFNFMTTHESRIWTQAGEPLLVSIDSVRIPPYFPDIPVVRKDVARKYSNIAEMDAQVGILLDQLEADGLLDSTIIFFFSDHGGMLPREKRELYETGLKVPFLVRFPGKRGAGSVRDELVSFVDFAPTVLSLAGVKPPEYMQGQAFLGKYKSKEQRKYIFAARDRMDTEYDMVRAVRDKRYKYLRNYHPELPYVQNIEYRKQIPMMNVLYEFDRDDRFTGVEKLWWRKSKPVEELYDTWSDPFEFADLAGDTLYRDKLEELRRAMDNWQNTYGDKGFIPEKELIRSMWGGEVQPVTAPVEFRLENQRLVLYSPTEGASIAWQYTDTDLTAYWNLYTDPIVPVAGETIRSKAIRIGYRESEVSTWIVP